MYGNRHAQKIYKRTGVTKFVPFQLFYSSNWNTASQLEAEQSRSKLAICQGSRSACTRKGRVHRSHDLPTTSSHHAHLSLGDAVLTVEAHCTQVALERNGTHHIQHGPSWADPPDPPYPPQGLPPGSEWLATLGALWAGGCGRVPWPHPPTGVQTEGVVQVATAGSAQKMGDTDVAQQGVGGACKPISHQRSHLLKQDNIILGPSHLCGCSLATTNTA